MIELLTLGFDDTVLHWFKSYQSNRTEFIFWRKTKSKGFLLKRGGPEGSLFGLKSLEGLEETIDTDPYAIQKWRKRKNLS
jgi:hypothetical protein